LLPEPVGQPCRQRLRKRVVVSLRQGRVPSFSGAVAAVVLGQRRQLAAYDAVQDHFVRARLEVLGQLGLDGGDVAGRRGGRQPGRRHPVAQVDQLLPGQVLVGGKSDEVGERLLGAVGGQVRLVPAVGAGDGVPQSRDGKVTC